VRRIGAHFNMPVLTLREHALNAKARESLRELSLHLPAQQAQAARLDPSVSEAPAVNGFGAVRSSLLAPKRPANEAAAAIDRRRASAEGDRADRLPAEGGVAEVRGALEAKLAELSVNACGVQLALKALESICHGDQQRGDVHAADSGRLPRAKIEWHDVFEEASPGDVSQVEEASPDDVSQVEEASPAQQPVSVDQADDAQPRTAGKLPGIGISRASATRDLSAQPREMHLEISSAVPSVIQRVDSRASVALSSASVSEVVAVSRPSREHGTPQDLFHGTPEDCFLDGARNGRPRIIYCLLVQHYGRGPVPCPHFAPSPCHSPSPSRHSP